MFFIKKHKNWLWTRSGTRLWSTSRPSIWLHGLWSTTVNACDAEQTCSLKTPQPVRGWEEIRGVRSAAFQAGGLSMKPSHSLTGSTCRREIGSREEKKKKDGLLVWRGRQEIGSRGCAVGGFFLFNSPGRWLIGQRGKRTDCRCR